jgi:hypothetical protein
VTRKLFQALKVLIVIPSLLTACGMAAYLASIVFRSPNPPSQIISERFNLCIAFEANLGSGEETLMFTHPCDVPLKKIDFGLLFDENTYLDFHMTMECADIEVADRDNDGIKEVYAVQQWLCKQFAHPWGKDPVKAIYRIDRDGRFTELDEQ